MKIEIEYNYKEILIPDYEKIIRRVVEEALDYENCPYETQVYVLLTDNEEIHQVNLAQSPGPPLSEGRPRFFCYAKV